MAATISFMKEVLPSDLHSTCNLLLFSGKMYIYAPKGLHRTDSLFNRSNL